MKLSLLNKLPTATRRYIVELYRQVKSGIASQDYTWGSVTGVIWGTYYAEKLSVEEVDEILDYYWKWFFKDFQ